MTAPTKEETHRQFYEAFHAWFMQSGCDFWSECDAPEELATIAVELSDRLAAESVPAMLAVIEAARDLMRYAKIENAASDRVFVSKERAYALNAALAALPSPPQPIVEAQRWRPIESAPTDGTPIIFANFTAMCLLTLTPHVWSGRYIITGDGERMMLECSFAATNENGEPTHWMWQPTVTEEFLAPYLNEIRSALPSPPQE